MKQLGSFSLVLLLLLLTTLPVGAAAARRRRPTYIVVAPSAPGGGPTRGDVRPSGRHGYAYGWFGVPPRSHLRKHRTRTYTRWTRR